MMHQKIRYTPLIKSEWKYTSEDSETTAAEVRQCVAGELWGTWNVVVPATGRYADILVHYDLEFKDPVSNLNLTLKDNVRPGARSDGKQIVKDALASSTSVNRNDGKYKLGEDDFVLVPRSSVTRLASDVALVRQTAASSATAPASKVGVG